MLKGRDRQVELFGRARQVNNRSSSICIEGRTRQKICREEPVGLSCSEGLVNTNNGSSCV